MVWQHGQKIRKSTHPKMCTSCLPCAYQQKTIKCFKVHCPKKYEYTVPKSMSTLSQKVRVHCPKSTRTLAQKVRGHCPKKYEYTVPKSTSTLSQKVRGHCPKKHRNPRIKTKHFTSAQQKFRK